MMTRARLEKPNQLPSGSRRCAGTACEHARRHRLQQSHLARPLDAAGVGRDEDVARALVALGLEPLDQRIGLGVDAVDLDAAQVGEVAVQRLVGVVVPRRIEVERRSAACERRAMITPAPRASPAFTRRVVFTAVSQLRVIFSHVRSTRYEILQSANHFARIASFF